jgi:hypothetical protein
MNRARAFVVRFFGVSTLGALLFVAVVLLTPPRMEPGSTLTWETYATGAVLTAFTFSLSYVPITIGIWIFSVTLKVNRGTPMSDVMNELWLGSRRYAERQRDRKEAKWV